jgi:hypothetical protein
MHLKCTFPTHTMVFRDAEDEVTISIVLNALSDSVLSSMLGYDAIEKPCNCISTARERGRGGRTLTCVSARSCPERRIGLMFAVSYAVVGWFGFMWRRREFLTVRYAGTSKWDAWRASVSAVLARASAGLPTTSSVDSDVDHAESARYRSLTAVGRLRDGLMMYQR